MLESIYKFNNKFNNNKVFVIKSSGELRREGSIMNKSKKLVFAFFISATIMNNKGLLHNPVHAATIMPDTQSSAYNSSLNIFTKYGYKGQCTWFTYGRVLEKLEINLPSEFYGNAVEWWSDNVRDKVYNYGSEPKANSIIVWGGGNRGYGHVAFVEKVEGNTVYFNEGNFSIRGAYDGKLKSISKEEIKNRGNLFLKGYIYLSSSTSPSNNKPTPPENGQANNDSKTEVKKGSVNISSASSTLNVRSSGSGSSEVIGALKKGTSVNIVGVSGDWYKVQYNSSYGYVSSKYITVNGTASTTPPTNTSNTPSSTTPTSNKIGTVNLGNKTSSLNLRQNPSGNIIGGLCSGTKVQILDNNGKWYKINSNGTIGYVCSDYISVSSENIAATPQKKTDSKIGTITLSDKSSTLNLRITPWTGRIVSQLTFGSKVEVLSSNGRWYKVKSGTTIGFVHSDYVTM